MTVAVAHQASSATRTIALTAGAIEAQLRGDDLAVLHLVETLDLDVEEAYRKGLNDEVEAALAQAGATGLAWQLHLATAPDDVGETLLELGHKVGADLLVIGARRRSPVGKALLGSVTQTVILNADIPVLVVKSSTDVISR